MNEREFLDGYDPNRYERPSVAVDLILASVVNGRPAALLMQRSEHPCLGAWSLPGGFVAINESLDAAANRVLATKVRMADAYVEQPCTFGTVERDPRTRVISVAYFALLPPARFAPR